MKYVYLILFAFGLFVVDPTPSLAQGACPGPNCRIELAAASNQDAIKKVDKKKSNQPVAKDTKQKESPITNHGDPSLSCSANDTKCKKKENVSSGCSPSYWNNHCRPGKTVPR